VIKRRFKAYPGKSKSNKQSVIRGLEVSTASFTSITNQPKILSNKLYLR
jgi:hypothetical protein